MTKLKAKLKFLGIQEGYGDISSHALYNVIESPRPDLHPIGSTITDATAKELGWPLPKVG